MTRVARASATFSGQVPAPAPDVFDLLTDWGGVTKWAPPEVAAMIGRIDLEGDPAALPLTRIVHTPQGHVIRETLLMKDADAGRIYYSLGDGGMPGLRNYVATATMDPTGDGGCTMTFSSTFDVDDPGMGASGGQQMMEAMYRGLISGLSAYFARAAA